MELIYYFLVFIVALVFGYYRGVVAGYHTKVRDEDKNPYMNILMEIHNDTFLFYNYVTGDFLAQAEEIDDGIAKLHTMFDKKFIVVKGESFNE